jgi:large subunit ribosomal protein L19
MSQDEKKKEENKEEKAKEEVSSEDVVEEEVEEVEEELPEPDPEVDDVSQKEEEKLLKAEKAKIEDFRVGDTVRIYYKIIEGENTRIQPYEGIVIAIKGKGVSKTFTVRRIGADGVSIERIFPLKSPNITKLEVKRRGKVKKSKLYYLRKKKGRAAVRVKERKAK